MKKHMRFLFLTFILYPSVAGLSYAGAPLKINFQGRLEQSGQPVEGAKNFTFKVYDALSGGSLVWTSQAESVAVANGAFSVVLETGTTVNLSTAAFAGARYVEITVDGVPLSPRQEIVSAPYAMVAQALSSDAVISLSNLEKDPSAPSTINTSTNAVDWTQLKNVPAGFADGLDDTLAGGLSTGAITSGKFSYDRVYITTGAFYGGFNGADQLVKLDGSGKLTALDGAALTNVNSAAMGALAASTGTLTVNLAAVALSTGPLANSGNWSGALGVGGAMTLPIKTITEADRPYTVTGNDSTIVVDASAQVAEYIINLPSAVGIAGRIYTFKRVDDPIADALAVTITPALAQTIDGFPTLQLVAMKWVSVVIQSDGSNWLILSGYDVAF